jgi:hypothetical protein
VSRQGRRQFDDGGACDRKKRPGADRNYKESPEHTRGPNQRGFETVEAAKFGASEIGRDPFFIATLIDLPLRGP